MSLGRFFDRVSVWQAERFPLIRKVPLAALLAAAALAVSAVLGGRPLPGPGAAALGTLLALTLLFQMRVVDEMKEARGDRQHRPERPIARGVIRLWTVTILGLGSLGVSFLAAALWGAGQIMLLVVVWAWLFLVLVDFGSRSWLAARPIWRLAARTAILPLLVFMLTGIEWWGHGGPAPGLAVLLALAFVNGWAREIGGGTLAPANERAGVESWSGLWGPAVAAWVWVGTIAVAAVLMTALGWLTGTALWLGLVGAGGTLAAAALAARFQANPLPRTEAPLAPAARGWVLASYGAAALVPPLLGG